MTTKKAAVPAQARETQQRERTTRNPQMPATYKKNIGALFKNHRRTDERHPLLTGGVELDPSLIRHLLYLVENGLEAHLSLAAWKNTSKAGESYFTIKVSPKYVRPEPVAAPTPDADELDL
jgi:hypothetical protein